MKKLSLIIISISYFFTSFGQNYQLLPDTCTFCFFFLTHGGDTWEHGNYMIDINNDSIINSNRYIKVYDFYARQVGNKVYGIPTDSTNEFLIMDFDAQIGDTLNNLYSNSHLYSAIIESKDSMVLNDGSYHHLINLKGIEIYPEPQYPEYPWFFTWHERGLCHSGPYFGNELGGLTMNIPVNNSSISPLYVSPSWCTSNPLYNNPDNNQCNNCIGIFGNTKEYTSLPKIYPNPTSDYIHFENIEEYQIQIIDITGKTILIPNIKNSTLDITFLNNGIYTINFLDNGAIISSKLFIKN